MSPGPERCLPAQSHRQGQRSQAAKCPPAGRVGWGFSSELGELSKMSLPMQKFVLPGQHGVLTLRGVCPSVSWRGWSWEWREEAEEAAAPTGTHSLMEELTLDKQLQSIYLGPYGVGEQVCG